MFELLLQMRAREFQRDELVPLICLARSGQRLVRDGIVPWSPGQIIAFDPAALRDLAAPSEIKAELDASRMKTLSPVKRTLRPKVVPFYADPELLNIPVEGTPPVLYFPPRFHFSRR